MTTRQFTSFIAAVCIWIVMIYYGLLAISPFALDDIKLSPYWYWWMFFMGMIPVWIFSSDVREKR